MKVSISELQDLGRVEKVLLDGVDITHRCFEADDRKGTAGCYKVDDVGKFYVVDDLGQRPTYMIKDPFHSYDVAKEVLHGKVKIIMRGIINAVSNP